MKAWISTLIMVLAFSFSVQEADARKKKHKKKAKVAEATEETKTAIVKMMGDYKWDMRSEKVIDSLELDLRKGFVPRIRKTKDALKQDALRREMMDKVKELRKNLVKFTGKRTPWDVSLIDKEFDHKNDESMVPHWGKRDRRFYFFHDDGLYKIYIAFNADLFKGKTFEDFAGVMEARFGPAERKYATTIMGKPKLDHLAWPAADGTMMKAIDNTGFYGNFCLVLVNLNTQERVMSGREMNNPKNKGGDPLVEAATQGKADLSDENESIIDQITGKDQSAPDTVGESLDRKKNKKINIDDPGAIAPESKKVKKRKISDDPLDGLDI